MSDAINKDDTLLLLAQAGFGNELVTLKNKHRACQCLIIHVVLKTRSEELQQLREGLESVSLLQFLQMCHNCTKYVFPLVNDVKLKACDVINIINKEWLRSLVGEEKNVMNWFQQYIEETEEGESNTGDVHLCQLYFKEVFCGKRIISLQI